MHVENLFFAGVAGITGATTVFPIDLVKTRLQSQTKEMLSSGKSTVQYNGMVDCFKKTYQAGGIKSFYKVCQNYPFFNHSFFHLLKRVFYPI